MENFTTSPVLATSRLALIESFEIGVSLILKVKDVDTPSSSIFSSAFPGLTAFTLLKLSISTKSFQNLFEYPHRT